MKLLVKCSGLSNCGRLTTQIVTSLMRSKPGVFAWIHARKPPEEIHACAEDADELCEGYCATKKLGAASVEYPCRYHVVATERGIVKNGMADVRL